MEYAETLKQVQDEALRRAREDHTARVVYYSEANKLGICTIDDFDDQPILDMPLSIVWKDKIEVL